MNFFVIDHNTDRKSWGPPLLLPPVHFKCVRGGEEEKTSRGSTSTSDENGSECPPGVGSHARFIGGDLVSLPMAGPTLLRVSPLNLGFSCSTEQSCKERYSRTRRRGKQKQLEEEKKKKGLNDEAPGVLGSGNQKVQCGRLVISYLIFRAQMFLWRSSTCSLASFSCSSNLIFDKMFKLLCCGI